MNLKPVHIHIRNFQSIEDVELEVRGLTVITGKTNIGKSAIVRSISSAIMNNSVIGMVRKGASFASVDIRSDDYSFRWEKGEKGVNRYLLGDRILDKVGAKPIDEIIKMGFGSVRVGSEDIYPWLASQFFPIFLLDKTGSQVTEFISEVSRLNVLQDATTLSNRKKKRLNDTSGIKEAELKKLRSKKAHFGGIQDIKSLHDDISEQIKSIEMVDLTLTKLNQVSDKLKLWRDRVIALQKVALLKTCEAPDKQEISRFVQAKKIHQLIESNQSSISRISDVKELKNPISVLEDYDRYRQARGFSWIPAERKSIESLSGVGNLHVPADLQDNIRVFNAACQQLVKIRRIMNSVSALKSVKEPSTIPEVERLKSMKVIKNKLDESFLECKKLKKKLDDYNSELIEVEQGIAQIPLCPTCSRPHVNHPI